LIIHTREATDDTLRILREEGAGQVGGVFHCFTETWEVAQEALALGFHISISGIVTFKKATQVHQVASLVPQDKLLVETDAPYLAPVPHRGKLNHPALVRHVAEEVARLRSISIETLANATSANFQRLFGIQLHA
jgi:TatD DNase family protein